MCCDSLKIQEAQDKQEESCNMKEEDNETKKIVSEMEQLKEQLQARESALLRTEVEKLRWSERLQDSRDDMNSVAKERDDQQRLQEVILSESDQLKGNREIMAKVSLTLFPMCVVFK